MFEVVCKVQNALSNGGWSVDAVPPFFNWVPCIFHTLAFAAGKQHDHAPQTRATAYLNGHLVDVVIPARSKRC